MLQLYSFDSGYSLVVIGEGGWRYKRESDIFPNIAFTEYGTALTTILPILFLYLNTVTVTAETFEP